MLVLTDDGENRGKMSVIQYLRSLDYDARPKSVTGNILVYDRVDFADLLALALVSVHIRGDRGACIQCGGECEIHYDPIDVVYSCPVCGTFADRLY